MALGIGLCVGANMWAFNSGGGGLPSDGNRFVIIGASNGILIGPSNGIYVS